MNVNVRNDENGYAIILAIMLLAILMVAGVMVSSTSIKDYEIVRNNIIYSQNLAAAESASMTAIQTLENQTLRTALDPASSTLESGGEPQWLNAIGEVPDGTENVSTYDGKWKDMTIPPSIASRLSAEDAKLRYRFVGWQPAKGASLGVYSDTIMQEGRVRGCYYSAHYGSTSIELGYKKRF